MPHHLELLLLLRAGLHAWVSLRFAACLLAVTFVANHAPPPPHTHTCSCGAGDMPHMAWALSASDWQQLRLQHDSLWIRI
jgi:hypothetical protein